MIDLDSKIVPIDIIEDGTEVQMTMNNDLYKRIQNLIFKGLPFKDMKHFIEVAKQVQLGDFKTDPLAYHLYTCIALSTEFEEAAKKQGKIIKKTYNIDTKEIKLV